MSDYKRFPIILDRDTILVLQVFTRSGSLEDLWISEYTEKPAYNEKAAEQLIAQLEDHWTPAFLMSLREEITKKLNEHNKEYGTSF